MRHGDVPDVAFERPGLLMIRTQSRGDYSRLKNYLIAGKPGI